MSEAIYYFSGTENSYSAAIMLSEYIKPAEVINVFDAPKRIRHDSVGLVFPVYSYDVPKAIKEFISAHDLSDVTYIYAVCTSAGDAGNVFHNLDALLSNKGKSLNYGAELKLGDNSLVISTRSELLAERSRAARGIIKHVSRAVSEHRSDNRGFKYSILKSLLGVVTDLALKHYYGVKRKSADADKCTKCGKCVEICTPRNITVNEGAVTFGNRCHDCFGCINRCPRGAISFGKISPVRYRQYRKPDIFTGSDI